MMTLSGFHTWALGPNSFSKMPNVGGPQTSCVSSLSTFVQMLSPGDTFADCECLASIFSVKVRACFTYRKSCFKSTTWGMDAFLLNPKVEPRMSKRHKHWRFQISLHPSVEVSKHWESMYIEPDSTTGLLTYSFISVSSSIRYHEADLKNSSRHWVLVPICYTHF